MNILEAIPFTGGSNAWFNLVDYTLFDLILVSVGTLFWVVCYVAVIRNGFKMKYAEMPMFVGAGNIAWEFIWSFFEQTNMGVFYLWGYRAWFVLDLFIFFLIFKYGHKQTNIPLLQKYWKYCFVLVTVFFCFFFYYFAQGGYDTPIGATSAFFLSVGISTLYITQLLANKNPNNYSWTAAWTRACGDTIMTIFALHYYNITIIGVMGAYVVSLDLIYVILLYKMRKEARLKAATTE